MKYLSIVLFLFMIQVSISVINGIGILHSELQPQAEWFDAIDNEQLANESYIQGEVSADSFGFGDFIKGFWYFIKAVGLGIISIPYTLGIFGLRSPFIYYFSIPVYFLYFLAVAQFLANRGTKSMR